ncbi:MAG: MaoC family dehydratase [Actinomycetota bacterium]|nr:MaoC family dehydratase [Acidimicrobiia bacterium]MDQ3292872.1 MaoC family dehydratase [Actinomycetota bacterium]
MKYFEDFVVGEEFECGAYEVTADEIVAFARQYDPQPFHLDQAAADASVFGGLTASGFHTVAMQGALINASPEADAAIVAGLGWDEVRFAHPVWAGDTLSVRFTCLEVRASASKPDRGVVRTSVVLRNQDGQDVLSSVHNLLLKRRPTTPEV